MPVDVDSERCEGAERSATTQREGAGCAVVAAALPPEELASDIGNRRLRWRTLGRMRRGRARSRNGGRGGRTASRDGGAARVGGAWLNRLAWRRPELLEPVLGDEVLRIGAGLERLGRHQGLAIVPPARGAYASGPVPGPLRSTTTHSRRSRLGTQFRSFRAHDPPFGRRRSPGRGRRGRRRGVRRIARRGRGALRLAVFAAAIAAAGHLAPRLFVDSLPARHGGPFAFYRSRSSKSPCAQHVTPASVPATITPNWNQLIDRSATN